MPRADPPTHSAIPRAAVAIRSSAAPTPRIASLLRLTHLAGRLTTVSIRLIAVSIRLQTVDSRLTALCLPIARLANVWTRLASQQGEQPLQLSGQAMLSPGCPPRGEVCLSQLPDRSPQSPGSAWQDGDCPKLGGGWTLQSGGWSLQLPDRPLQLDSCPLLRQEPSPQPV